MKILVSEMSEKELKENLELMVSTHNSLTQQLYKLKERIGIFQAELLRKQKKRILTMKLLELGGIDLEQLKKATGLNESELMKGMSLIDKNV